MSHAKLSLNQGWGSQVVRPSHWPDLGDSAGAMQREWDLRLGRRNSKDCLAQRGNEVRTDN